MTKKRLTYIDMSKGLGILLITYGHITTLGNPIDSWMSLFKITIFYIISGYLLALSNKAESYTCMEYGKRLFYSIMKPYFLFSIIGFFYRFSILSLKADELDLSFAKDYIYSTVTLRGVSTFWFLPTLFFGNLIFFWILRQKKRWLLAFPLTLPIVIGSFSASLLSSLLESLSKEAFLLVSYPILVIAKSSVAIWFLAIGYLLFFLHGRIPKGITRLLLGIVGLLMTWFLSTRTSGIDFNNLKLGSSPALFYIGGVIGSFSCLLTFEFISNFSSLPPLVYFGKNSLLLMILQRIFYLIAISTSGWKSIAGIANTIGLRYYIDCFGILCILLLMAYPIIEFINDNVPFLMKKHSNPKTEVSH